MMESKKAKQRLNLISKTQISMKNRALNFGPFKRGVLVPYGKYSFFISLESPIGYFEIYKVDKKGTILFANHSALKEKYEMVLQKELPQVCPLEDQAGVTHAISPIAFKLSQSVRIPKLFKNTERFGILAHPWDINAPTIIPWGKRLTSALKMHFYESLPH